MYFVKFEIEEIASVFLCVPAGQWWFFARANNYYRTTNARADNRLMPLDLKKYTLFKKLIGDVKDLYVKSKKELAGLLGGIIKKIRKRP